MSMATTYVTATPIALEKYGPWVVVANRPLVPVSGKEAMRILTAVGFEPTRFSPPELESGALDRSAKLSNCPKGLRNGSMI